MASRGRRGRAPAHEDKPRREERAEQQAPAPQGPVLPHHRLWIMECSCKAMQRQAHTQAALQAQLEARERADVWWASLLRTRFEDGAIEVAWDEFVRLFRAKFVHYHIQDRMEQEFLSLTQGSMTMLEYEARFAELSKYAPHIVTDERRKVKKSVMGLKPSLRMRLVAFDHRTLDEALSAACRQEGEMQQYLEEKKASQKRPGTTFQRQDKKKTVYQTQQRSLAVGSTQVPSVRSPGVKKECPHCGKTHGGSECWMIAGKCLKCGSSDHKIKDCPRLQQGVQREAPALAVVAVAAPATGRPGRPRALARMKDFDAILGLDWLEEHYALVDCRGKRIVFRIPGEDEFSHPLPRNLAGKLVIFAMKVMSMVNKGCDAFLASVVLVPKADDVAQLTSPEGG
ncbi:hypothetical protein Taro_012930 [Colocasia esculenta]|uniref:CCHC-type domain-containing protein n=1 Tax=Colocasia esculenta TaxID=4460 RepID=A0A843UEG5_COLES|nr:hypothetical protein [Colocasia esculenta]